MTEAALAEFESDMAHILTDAAQSLADIHAREIEAAPLPLWATLSPEYGAGYRQCQQDMATRVRGFGKEGKRDRSTKRLVASITHP